MKGFASVDPHSVSAGRCHSLALTATFSQASAFAEDSLIKPTEEAHTDHEEHVQDTPHQRLPELLKHSYKYALRLPQVISDAAKRSSSHKVSEASHRR